MVLFTSHALSSARQDWTLQYPGLGAAFDTGLPVRDVRVQLTTEQLMPCRSNPP